MRSFLRKRSLGKGFLAAGAMALALAVLPVGQALAADPGDQIKEGAVQVGEGIKNGAIRFWEAVKAGANSMGDKLSGHSTPEPVKPAPAAPATPPANTTQ